MDRPERQLFDAHDVFTIRAAALPSNFLSNLQRGNYWSDLPGDVKTAIAIASPDLYHFMRKPSRRRGGAPRGNLAVLQYLTRMSTRATPFGTFASVGLGHWGNTTDITIKQTVKSLSVRPTLSALLSMVQDWESRPEVFNFLRLVLHSCAHCRGERLVLSGIDKPVAPLRGWVRANEVIRALIEVTKRPKSVETIIEELRAKVDGLPQAHARSILRTLCSLGFLVSDLRPPLSAKSPLSFIIERAESVPCLEKELVRLKEIGTDIDSIQSAVQGQTAESFIGLGQRIQALAKNRQRETLYINACLGINGTTVSRSVVEEAAKAAEILIKISKDADDRYLRTYRGAFLEKYGENRRVPLLELMSPVNGLGSPFQRRYAAESQNFWEDSRRTLTLSRLATTSLWEKERAVRLSREDLNDLASWGEGSRSPSSLDFHFQISSKSREDVNQGEFQVIVNPVLGGSPAGASLSRFAECLGPSAVATLEQWTSMEMHSRQTLSASLLYLPVDLSAADLVCHPAVRRLAIGATVTAASSGIPSVPLDEVSVDVFEDRFRLIWAQPGQDPVEIVAFSDHRLNSKAAPTICRFISEASQDRVARLRPFSWGPFEVFPFLPRVETGRAVLRPAQWRLEVGQTRSEVMSIGEFSNLISSWRHKWNVPRWLNLVDSSRRDERLLIDLDNEEYLQIVLKKFRRLPSGKSLCLEEMLPDWDHLWLEGPTGRHAFEIVASLIRTDAIANSQDRLRPIPVVAQQVRVKPVGCEWLYLKLYCDTVLENLILQGPLLEFAGRLVDRGEITRWMFTRYLDPEPHLRIRFGGDSASLRSRVFEAVCDWASELMTRDLATKFSFDTYEREVERYGGEISMSVSEDIQAADSLMVCRILNAIYEGKTSIPRRDMALFTVDDLLSAFAMSVEERLFWAKTKLRSRQSEKGNRSDALRHLELLRDVRSESFRALVAARHRVVEILAKQMRNMEQSGALTRDIRTIINSLVHLHCNRFLGRDRRSEYALTSTYSRVCLYLLRTKQDYLN